MCFNLSIWLENKIKINIIVDIEWSWSRLTIYIYSFLTTVKKNAYNYLIMWDNGKDDYDLHKFTCHYFFPVFPLPTPIPQHFFKTINFPPGTNLLLIIMIVILEALRIIHDTCTDEWLVRYFRPQCHGF